MINKILIILIFFSAAFNSFSVTNIEINKAIKDYFKDNKIEKKFSINKKLKLPSCTEEIKINKKFNSLKTLEIICPQKSPWTYNVRTKITSNKKKYIKKKNLIKGTRVVKINKDLKKGNKIQESDLYYEKTSRKGGTNYFSDKDQVLGRIAKISIRKNQILRERHIEKNWTIKEGQKVIIENNRSNVQILIDGIALNSAMKNDYMLVLNKSTGKEIKAWVKNNKKVSIFR